MTNITINYVPGALHDIADDDAAPFEKQFTGEIRVTLVKNEENRFLKTAFPVMLGQV